MVATPFLMERNKVKCKVVLACQYSFNPFADAKVLNLNLIMMEEILYGRQNGD